MVGFCVDCFNRMNEMDYPPKKYELSDNLGLCEGCGELKPVVTGIKPQNVKRNKEKFFIFPVLSFVVKTIIKYIMKMFKITA